jgi:hypothetical protein
MLLILNLTQSAFIRVDGIKTMEYNQKMNELLTIFEKDDLSHWNKTDKIIIVPENLNDYVEKIYGEIYI